MNNSNTPKNPMSLQRAGILVMVSSLMSGFALTMCQNYAAYSYTDLAHISTTTMSFCMTTVSAIAVCISLVSGAIITSTRTKLGQFRPWLLGATITCLIGGFLIFFNVGNSVMLKAVVISIGYLMANSSMDFVGTAQPALIGKLAGADSDGRNFLMSRKWVGGNCCYIISGFAVVPLVAFLGSGNETLGFLLTQSIFTIIVLCGTILMFKVTKDYDPDNTGDVGEAAERVKFSEMLKAVLTNRLAVPVLLSDIVRFTGYYVLMSMMAYQSTKVIGSMLAMSYALGSANFSAFIGALIAPKVTKKIGGRKKTIAVFGLLAGLGFGGICIFGKTLWGFVIPCCLGFFFMSFIDTLDMMLYMDAGEYWLHETGHDTRPYLLSMYSVAVKVAIALSATVLGLVLSLINYNPDVVLDAAGASTLTLFTGLMPALGYLLPLVIMLIHNVSDEQMAVIIKENEAKYGN